MPDLLLSANALHEWATDPSAMGRVSMQRLAEEVSGYVRSILDDTALDDSWLRSVGGRQEDHPDKITFDREDALPVGLWRVDDGWKAMLLHSPHAATCIVRGLKTRGDVRRLAAALGITLKESP